MARKGIRHRGGGWYELPDGRVIRGRAAAEEALAETRPAAADEAGDGEAPGRVASAVAGYVASLDLGDDDHIRLALAALALSLARSLDADAGMAAAAVSKELRATLAELEGAGDGDDDPFTTWEAQLGQPAR